MTMNSLNPILERVTQRITERSAPTRRAYLDHMAAQRTRNPFEQRQPQGFG